MLQQTRVETVIPYYRKFLRKFPTVESLASADLAAVLKVWEGLGYYARARNLHKAAGVLVSSHRGKLPRRSAELRTLPGIGEYTAAAIASIAFDEAVPALDGNARRVLSRWIALASDPASRSGMRRLREKAARLLDPRRPGEWNQAVMELGATICLPAAPRCGACPVSGFCQAYRINNTAGIPRRKKRLPTPHYQVTAGVIQHRGRILIARRKEHGLLGGLWEFPGGKQEPGESLEECLQRELQEELNIRVAVGEKLTRIRHAYTHFRITLHVFFCRWIGGHPEPVGCSELKWVRPSELTRYAFPKADHSIIELLLNRS
jgi:A/G-specific adenine glycosylase